MAGNRKPRPNFIVRDEAEDDNGTLSAATQYQLVDGAAAGEKAAFMHDAATQHENHEYPDWSVRITDPNFHTPECEWPERKPCHCGQGRPMKRMGGRHSIYIGTITWQEVHST